MTKQSLPAVSTVTSDTVEDFKTQDKIVLIAYFGADDKASNETTNVVADSLRDDYLFGATSDAALAETVGVKQPSLVMYKDFDEPVVKYEGDYTADDIEKWVKAESMPLVGEIGPDTYAGYMAVSVIWESLRCRQTLITIFRLAFLLPSSLAKPLLREKSSPRS